MVMLKSTVISYLLLIGPSFGRAFPLDGVDSTDRRNSPTASSSTGVYVAVGTAHGARLGALYFLTEKISLEVAFGTAFTNLFGASDIENRLTVGTNYNPFDKSELVFSLLIMTRARPFLEPRRLFQDVYLSFGAGLMPRGESGMSPIFRVGGLLRVYHLRNPVLNAHRERFLNVDIGLSYSF
jgi:hypothetical protein